MSIENNFEEICSHMGVFGLFSGTLYEPVSYHNNVPRTIDAPHFCRSEFPIWAILPSATILALARSGTRYRSVIETGWWLKERISFWSRVTTTKE